MEKIITQSVIGRDKKDSPIYGAAGQAIVNESKKITNLIQRFKAFCEGQQKNRLGWTAFTMVGQICIALITLLAVFYNGNRFVLWIPVILSSFVIEVTNLTALPTKITIPIFCTSVLINAGVIILSFVL